jgi:hypothetical protein
VKKFVAIGRYHVDLFSIEMLNIDGPSFTVSTSGGHWFKIQCDSLKQCVETCDVLLKQLNGLHIEDKEGTPDEAPYDFT